MVCTFKGYDSMLKYGMIYTTWLIFPAFKFADYVNFRSRSFVWVVGHFFRPEKKLVAAGSAEGTKGSIALNSQLFI